MKLKKLKADGHIYPIKEILNLTLDDEQVWGYVKHDQPLICIEKSLCESKRQEILLHEIIHIAGDELFHFKELEKTKKGLGIVNKFTTQLFQILKDNGLLNLP